jgi:predicted nucleic acid-binding protein
MKIYLDTCCLNRPFDDQRQPRIRLESEAVTLILERAYQREWEWLGSDILFHELEQIGDIERRERTLFLAKQCHQVVEVNEKVLNRAEELQSIGFDSYDAIHLASAEIAKVDIFLTSDDDLQKLANRNKKQFSFTVINPVQWLEEVLK